jgi:hypothetical protein
MSRAAKLTLMGTSLFALSTVVFVHYTQKAEQVVRFRLSSVPPHPFPSIDAAAPSIPPPTTPPSQVYLTTPATPSSRHYPPTTPKKKTNH